MSIAVEQDQLKVLQEKIWHGSIPLEIKLSASDCRTFDESMPYLIQFPRLSYLPFLLPRLHQFFLPSLINPDLHSSQGWFSFEDVPLKWQHPLGLLYDTLSGAVPFTADEQESTALQIESKLPWKLVLHFSEFPSDTLIPLDADGRTHHDVFVNSVKEADFLRNGTAKVMMSLSKEDSTDLWRSVQDHDLALFNSINQKFLQSPGMELRHVPMKVYLPSAPLQDQDADAEKLPIGMLKVVQGLVTPTTGSGEPQTLGSALHNLLPTVFPSRRSYIFAHAVMHGAVLPLSAPVQEIMRSAAYADGFLHVAVIMVS